MTGALHLPREGIFFVSRGFTIPAPSFLKYILFIRSNGLHRSSGFAIKKFVHLSWNKSGESNVLTNTHTQELKMEEVPLT
ncbi:hypothetical protein MNBD_GAMMA24-221 [hydrothermal vent metagenome]|uniref:Uncharacterized protein n=1 Tax=hydrothermal vent metagenome TaxID=652676 RepID=A0A3B1BKM1_9ZZZZ